MSAASTIIHKQNKYIQIFNSFGAIDEKHAITLEEVGIKRRFVFNRMCDRGIFLQCSDGRFYIDNKAADLFREMRKKRAKIILIIVIVVLALLYSLGYK